MGLARRIAVAGLLIVLPFQSFGADLFQDGLTAYQAGDYARAASLWESLPDDARALFNLGQMHRRGEGFPADPSASIPFYERAAELGHRSAQANLGTLYFFGAKPNPERAIKWWRLAAIAGEPHSQHMMGVAYVNGDYLSKDLVKGFAWNDLAARQGYKKAEEAREELLKYLSPEEVAGARELAPTLLLQPRDLDATVKETPQPAAAKGNPPLKTASGEHWIQFGALSTQEAAEKLWRQLSEKQQQLTQGLDHRVSPLTQGSRKLFRLQAGGFATSSEAKGRCGKFSAQGISCIPISVQDDG